LTVTGAPSRMADDGEETAVQEQLAELNVEDELSLEFGKKKKKKTKKAVDAGENGAAPAEGDQAATAAPADGEPELDLDLTKKKKKKKKVREEGGFDEDMGAAAGDGEGASSGRMDTESEDRTAGGGSLGWKMGSQAWSGTDRDYQYDELLTRVFNILKERNPELTGERRRTVLKPPQVAREGTKKTVFTNFMDLCKAMNRQQEHVSMYLLAELGTSGSLDGQQRLVVKGRFLPKSFETVLRRYVGEYVLCGSCKSMDTLLDKDSTQRLMHLRCQQCGASRTVSAIKSGFVARVTRRVQAPG